ncbi:hypothetical protein IL252_15850 [Halomicrobium sp. IBSBa]|uniref:hypothetical protein n=1 Tax=Halomicrobium sp. IBSBa TaxID=2778916 RepID=UPI001ABFDDA9|nr:hypothetical protein [Halomicrobium sp. IBSBa]MBO4249287.1 hypothetical protein [Halomicrobium sp. IBSBa]
MVGGDDAGNLVSKRLSRGTYSTILELSDANQRIVRDIVIDGEINGKSRFVEDGLDGDNVVNIAKKMEAGEYDNSYNPSMNDIRVIAETNDQRTVFVTKQRIDHAVERHVLGEDISAADRTTFYPTGNRISKEGIPDAQLPARMTTSNKQIRNTMKDLSYRTIRKGSDSGSKITYKETTQQGIKTVQVGTSGENVKTVFPTEDPSVRRWNGNEWEKWTKNGWVEWKITESSSMTFEIHIEGKENIDRQIDGEEMAFCYPSYEFVDVSRDDGVEIEASDETTAYQFFRQFLSVFYSIAGNYPSELSNPKRITVKHDGCSKEYSHLSIIVRRRGDNLEVGVFDGMLDSSDIKIEWDEKELEATTEVDLLSFMQEVIDESTDYIEKIEPKKPDGISKKRILDLFETAEQIYEHTKTEVSKATK